ncbi:uncharacterized protein TNCV_2751591 [Trichonephila clavipes]|nr:uncharacterized protein TNCV_2751591 [Trichonephila clavipes]
MDSDDVHNRKLTNDELIEVHEQEQGIEEEFLGPFHLLLQQLEANRKDVKELLNSHNHELVIDKLIEIHEQDQGIEERERELEFLNSVQSEDRMVWLVTLTVVPLGLGSNPGKDMGVCKWRVPSLHGGTLNSRRAASPLVRLVEREERWEAPDHPQGVLPQN